MDTIFNMPMDEAERRYLQQRPPVQPVQQRGITDYLPNIFGGNPAQIAGLLGEEQAGAISRQANVSGLLGAAIAIANGMSSQGPRRSAAQNILNALGTGLQTSQGVYQNSLERALVGQRMAKESQEARLAQLRGMGELQQQGERSQLYAEQQTLLSDPLIQQYPELRALVLKDPKEAAATIRALREREEFKNRDRGNPQPASQAVSNAGGSVSPTGEAVLPSVEVTANNVSPLLRQIKEADSAAIFYANRGDAVNAERYQKFGESLRAQLGTQEMQGGIAQSLSGVYPTLKGRVEALIQDAPSMTREQIVSEKNSILSEDAKIRGDLDPTLFAADVAKRKAGATTINMPSESERKAGFLTNRVVNSLNQLQSVLGETPTAASPNFSAEAVKFFTRSDVLKNMANPEARQRVEAAQLEILDAALTLGTGAAYTREQLENYRTAYFPQLNDKPGTIKDKQARLKALIDSAMIASGRAASSVTPVNPTAAPSIDINAVQRELERRKGGK